MFDISPIQIILVLGLALIVFGPKRLPEMGRNLGKGLRDFKGGLSGESADPDPTAVRVAAVPEDARPSIERVIKDNVTPEPVHETTAPRAA